MLLNHYDDAKHKPDLDYSDHKHIGDKITPSEAGLVPVLAAMTGLSEAAVGGILGAGGLTIEGLIAGFYSKMGAC